MNHFWGDDWFKENGEDLASAIYFCMDNWQKWGRISCHGKEKFGTFRHNVSFYRAEWPIHELVKPGYLYYRFPSFLIKLEFQIGKVIKIIQLDKLIRLYQYKVYNSVIQRACKRWPKLVDELVSDSDYPELIKGKVSGITIYNKYWEPKIKI